MSDFDFDEDDEPGLLGQHPVLAGLLVLIVLGAGGYGWHRFSAGGSAPAKTEHFTMVALPPPPPPPPTPPPPPQQAPPKEQKMEEQAPVEKEEPAKPEPPKPDEPAPLGSNIKGDGPPDGFGLSGSGGGGGSGPGGGGSPRSKYGWYAGQVQSRIAEAIRTNKQTRTANLRVEVRVWPDATGRITRAQLAGSSGNAALDEALRNEILVGLRLPEPPPAGMPLPIVMRLTALRPR